MTDAAQGDASGWSPERSAAGGHNPYLIAFVVLIATFMEVLDTTIANVALRHIAGGLAVGIDESTYVITSYLVANAIVLSISGWLSTVHDMRGDVFGRVAAVWLRLESRGAGAVPHPSGPRWWRRSPLLSSLSGLPRS
ncbi:MFS family permease [Bradyrhizobium japonicum]|nr:MFS family permease [Bradyrhizobium japonicum]MCS3962254.1 MFS family permease [Bradyrhizobium japonicum]MCS3994571.1 MFS family permease [Bradyrhizobium japonicum]